MKKNRKKYIALSKLIVLSFIVLFCLFPLVNTNTIVSSITKLFKADNEVELDNWEISTVFYDSTVNDGKTPLTEINWDASNLDFSETDTRTITVQINYKNTNTVTTYNPGQLKITIDNLGHNLDQCYVVKNYGVNDKTHTGYDWTLIQDSEKILLENAVPIEYKTNLEGDIRFEYRIVSQGERSKGPLNDELVVIDAGKDFCIHSSNKQIQAVLNNTLLSNELKFDYYRKYTHPWEHYEYTIEKKPSKIVSYDGLGDNPSDYIWVKYTFKWNWDSSHYGISGNTEANYPILYAKSATFKIIDDNIPDDCVVYGKDKLEKTNGVYELDGSIGDSRWGNPSRYIYVGYPKTKYSLEENKIVSNHANLSGIYYSEDEQKKLAEGNSTIDLDNYTFVPQPNNFSFEKKHYHNSSDQRIYYESIIGEHEYLNNVVRYDLYPNITYNDYPADVIIGDDVLFITDKDNKYRRLDDNEYYIKTVVLDDLYNNNGQKFEYSKYNAELWVRYENESDYVMYSKINEMSYYFTNLSKRVVGVYIKLYNIKEGMVTYASNYTEIRTVFDNVDESRTLEKGGSILNYGYMKIIKDGEIVNTVSANDYLEENSKNEIMQYDLENHGQLIQRDYDIFEYLNYDVPNIKYGVGVSDQMSSISTQNVSNETFEGKNNLFLSIGSSGNINNNYGGFTPFVLNKYYLEKGKIPNTITGWNMYNLLPQGMKLNSTKEDIESSLSFVSNGYSSSFGYSIWLYSVKDRKVLTIDEMHELIKNSVSVEIINNYKNYNRTMIIVHIDLGDDYLIFNENWNEYVFRALRFSYEYEIPYDAVIEKGNEWINNVYADFSGHEIDNNYYASINVTDSYWGPFTYPISKQDSGLLDNEETDINNNGNTSELIALNTNSIVINSIISTNQDLQVSVQSDKSNYDTGKVDTSNDSDYYYKLRARTGSNDVTNLVIYDSLEKYAKDPNMANVLASGGRGSWQGEFLGIDTSYAESKGYTVKTYYSENEEVGNLKDDDSWKEYNDSVDKSKVKSLAFEYLDESGKPAVLPANSLTYVLIKMKSPADENIKTLAYNGCWTEWNAIDPITGDKVDFITGINSNIVKVALPNSVEPVDIDFRVDKFWKDNNNEKKLRPDSVTLQVVPDGDVTQAIDVPLGSANADDSDSNHWYTTISVPKYDNNGNTIDYTVREDEVLLDNGYKYTPEIEDTTITNRLMKEIKLKKIWKDNSNSELTRPSNVTYKIKQNGNDYKDVVITGDYSTNEWNKTISVPVYDSSNNEYSYSIEEVNVNNYSSNCEGFTCTNTLSENNSIHITKKWIDNNNSYDTRPDSINVEILRNGTSYKTIELTKDNNWEYEEEVSKYDDNGNRYSYTIEENKVDEYDLVTYNQNTYEITNTLKTNMNIVITKKWIDDNNSDNTRPNELVITLLRNGEEYKEVTLTGDSDIWTSIVEVPKYDDNQKEYKYSIEENNTNDDYSDITYEDDLTVINKLSKNTDLTIKKKWIDHNNEYSSRPSEVNIKLLRNNEEYKSLKLSGNDSTWESIVKDVPMYDENGKKYIYTIEEDNIDKYSKVTYDQSNLEVTNELTEIPTVTLYFTVVNGYVDPKTGKMKYDEFGLNEILKKYNKTLEDEYIFKFKLENIETKKKYEGKLSTQGVLEFKDIPYGEYRAVVGKDKLFEFVDMLSIKDVNGVSFKKIGNEGYITIKPTGDNIVFGAKIINKIVPPINNPKTGINIVFIIALVLLIPIIVSKMVIKNRKVLDSY